MEEMMNSKSIRIAISIIFVVFISLPLTAGAVEKILYEFRDDPSDFQWYALNDTVMGGRSQSRLARLDNDVIVFYGNVSLENNGGFASVRSAAFLYGIDDYDGITLRVRGDGKQYKLRLQTETRSSLSYEQTFETLDGEWTDVRLHFENFIPVYFGRVVQNAPKLDPEGIRTFGIMISDKQAGKFRIEIDNIVAFKSGHGSKTISRI